MSINPHQFPPANDRLSCIRNGQTKPRGSAFSIGRLRKLGNKKNQIWMFYGSSWIAIANFIPIQNYNLCKKFISNEFIIRNFTIRFKHFTKQCTIHNSRESSKTKTEQKWTDEMMNHRRYINWSINFTIQWFSVKRIIWIQLRNKNPDWTSQIFDKLLCN